jgi:hypothetical protein
MSDKIRTYAELRDLIRVSLRMQNPEWVEPNGDSPVCDLYEARFAELLGLTHLRKNDVANSSSAFNSHPRPATHPVPGLPPKVGISDSRRRTFQQSGQLRLPLFDSYAAEIFAV